MARFEFGVATNPHPRRVTSDALKPPATQRPHMQVSVDVKGEGRHEVDTTALGDGDSATYADLLATLELSPQEVSVLVDGRPVPEDQPVASDEVTVLRLIKGG